jgi:RNA recognition motif-containing protein
MSNLMPNPPGADFKGPTPPQHAWTECRPCGNSKRQHPERLSSAHASSNEGATRHETALSTAVGTKVEAYRKEQRDYGGEFSGMNCYNTLFVVDSCTVTERKLLREMETFGSVKDIQIVKEKQTGKSRGYAFVEHEHEEDMKRAYRAADGMKIEGRYIVVDVERGHTVPTWLPRRLAVVSVEHAWVASMRM